MGVVKVLHTKTECDHRAVRLPPGEPHEGEWFPSEREEAVEIAPEQNTLAKSITKYILVAGWVGW